MNDDEPDDELDDELVLDLKPRRIGTIRVRFRWVRRAEPRFAFMAESLSSGAESLSSSKKNTRAS